MNGLDNQQRSPEQGTLTDQPGGAIGKPKRQALAKRRRDGRSFGQSRESRALEIETDGDGPVLQGEEYTAPLYEPGREPTAARQRSLFGSYYAGGSVEALTGTASSIRRCIPIADRPTRRCRIPSITSGSGSTLSISAGIHTPDMTPHVGGEEVIVRRQGNLLTAPLFYAAARVTEPWMFITREVTALGG